MRRRTVLRGMIAAAGVALWWRGSAAQAAGTAGTTVVVEGGAFSVGRAETRRALLAATGDGSNGGRVIVPLLTGGEARFPTRSTLLRPAPDAADPAEDGVARLIAEAHARGATVYASLDLLRWADAGTPPERDALRTRPAWVERGYDGGTGGAALGRYVSPFEPKAQAALADLVREIVSRYPDLDGIALRFALPTAEYLGYGEATRAATIRGCGVDPADINFSSEADVQRLSELVRDWRRRAANAFVRRLCGEARAAASAGTGRLRVAVFGEAATHRADERTRARSLNDWRAWLGPGGADEVLLEGASGPDAAIVEAEAVALAKGAGAAVTVLRPAREAGRLTVPVPEGAGRGVVVWDAGELGRLAGATGGG